MESILGAIRGLKATTIDTIYDLFFSERRVIVATVLSFYELASVYLRLNLTTLLFGNLSERREIKLRSSLSRARFKNKTLDEILTMDGLNLEIEYEKIVCVTIRKGLLTTTLEFEVQGHPEKKIRFLLERSQIAEVARLVNRILPTKVNG